MKKFITCLLLGTLLGIIPPPLPAQQNQNQEIEALKKRVSELEKQIQTVENIEKLDLQAKLADANAKLANAEFDKFERELRDSNNKWLRNWSIFFLTIAATVGIAFWFVVKSLIADRVEKNLNGFKEAVSEQDVIKNQLRVLEKAQAATMLESIVHVSDEHSYPERIKALRDEVLLQVFEDEIYDLAVRETAMEVLAMRKSSRFISHSLEFLNSAVNWEKYESESNNTLDPRTYIYLLQKTQTQEAYQGLTEFLNRLITEEPKQKDLFLAVTMLVLVDFSVSLNMTDSVPILKRAIVHLKVGQVDHILPNKLMIFFDKFNDPEGIKEILTNHATNGMPDVKEKCLELLQKHDPEFVEQWRARETTDNST